MNNREKIQDMYSILNRIPLGEHIFILLKDGMIKEGRYNGMKQYKTDISRQMYLLLNQASENTVWRYPLGSISCIGYDKISIEQSELEKSVVTVA